jgi:hypothetical protein
VLGPDRLAGVTLFPVKRCRESGALFPPEEAWGVQRNGDAGSAGYAPGADRPRWVSYIAA